MTAVTVAIDVQHATWTDCRFVYEVNNEISVREQSIHSDQFEYSDHRKWFQDLLNDPDRSLFVGRTGGLRFGVLRFDLMSSPTGQCYQVSIALSPEFRGRGLSRALLEHGMALKKTEGAASFLAQVRPGNDPSLRLFSGAGFSSIGRTTVFGVEMIQFVNSC